MGARAQGHSGSLGEEISFLALKKKKPQENNFFWIFLQKCEFQTKHKSLTPFKDLKELKMNSGRVLIGVILGGESENNNIKNFEKISRVVLGPERA